MMSRDGCLIGQLFQPSVTLWKNESLVWSWQLMVCPSLLTHGIIKDKFIVNFLKVYQYVPNLT
jgi:hypothetical protein